MSSRLGQLNEPEVITDLGIATWTSGVRELVWRVPDDADGFAFGCTVPGHVHSEHGSFHIADEGLDEGAPDA